MYQYLNDNGKITPEDFNELNEFYQLMNLAYEVDYTDLTDDYIVEDERNEIIREYIADEAGNYNCDLEQLFEEMKTFMENAHSETGYYRRDSYSYNESYPPVDGLDFTEAKERLFDYLTANEFFLEPEDVDEEDEYEEALDGMSLEAMLKGDN